MHTDELRTRLQFSQLDVDGQLLAAAIDMHRDGVAGIVGKQGAAQRGRIGNGGIVDLHDHISDLQASRSGCSTWRKADDQRTVINGKIVLRLYVRIDTGDTYTQRGATGMRDMAILDDLRHDGGHAVRRDGEADATGRRVELRIDSRQGWNTDQVALHIHQRATAIARIDGRIRLDRVGDRRAALSLGDAAVQCADDAVRDGLR